MKLGVDVPHDGPKPGHANDVLDTPASVGLRPMSEECVA